MTGPYNNDQDKPTATFWWLLGFFSLYILIAIVAAVAIAIQP